MRKNYRALRELLDKRQQACDRISAIADVCEKEQRERTDEESAEFHTLAREIQLIDMRMRAINDSMDPEKTAVDANAIIRENMAAGRQTEIRLVRDLVTVSDATSGGIVPVRIQDIVRPLQEGLILDKVGLPLLTGLAGDYVWPVYEAVTASVLGEGVAISDSTIEMSKLTASPERIGVAIPVTRQTIIQTEGIIETIVRQVMPQAVTALLNKIMFSTEKVTGATNLAGPFVKAVESKTTLSSVPTFAELNAMKAKVLESGVSGDNLCWVMTKSQKAILEGTPINSNGIYRPMIENDTLCGLPVFTTNFIRKTTVSGKTTTVTEYIGIGDWKYQPMGLFGDISFIVDPYSQARKDAVGFVLNVNYATKTLRESAFAIGEVSAAAAAAA